MTAHCWIQIHEYEVKQDGVKEVGRFGGLVEEKQNMGRKTQDNKCLPPKKRCKKQILLVKPWKDTSNLNNSMLRKLWSKGWTHKRGSKATE